MGWAFIVVWGIGIAIIWSSYRTVSSVSGYFHQLTVNVEELGYTLDYPSPYQAQVIDSQALRLQIIYALRLQLDANRPTNLFLPDLSQLLYTTDSFISQAQKYIDNELGVLELVENLTNARQASEQNPTQQRLYQKLGTSILEAMFSTSDTTATIYRAIDEVYLASNKLNEQDRLALQQLLARSSTTLGSYAEGRYLVDKLANHEVFHEIERLRTQFNRVLERHFLSAIFFSLLMLLGQSLALVRAGKTRQEKAEQSRQLSVESTENIIALTTPQEAIDSEINIEAMFSSLNNDKATVMTMLSIFVEDHSEDVAKITQLLTDSPEDALRHAHSLKGVGGSLGAHQLRDAAAAVEKAIEEDISQVPQLLTELELRLNRAVAQAKHYLASQTDMYESNTSSVVGG